MAEEKTVIGRGVSIKGRLTGEETVLLQGNIDGQIKLKGTFELVESARFRGDIEVDEAVIGGAVEGSMRAVKRIQIQKSAHVKGDVTAPALAIAEGAHFHGKVIMEAEEADEEIFSETEGSGIEAVEAAANEEIGDGGDAEIAAAGEAVGDGGDAEMVEEAAADEAVGDGVEAGMVEEAAAGEAVGDGVEAGMVELSDDSTYKESVDSSIVEVASEPLDSSTQEEVSAPRPPALYDGRIGAKRIIVDKRR